MEKKWLFLGISAILALIIFANIINLSQTNISKKFLGIDWSKFAQKINLAPKQKEFILEIYNPGPAQSGLFSSIQESDAITDITYRTNIREEDLQDVVLKVNGIEVPAYPRIYEDMFGGSAKNLLDTGVLFVPDLFKNGENHLGVTAFDKKGRTSAYSANIRFDNEVQLDGYQPEENKGLPTFKVESFKVNVKVEKKPLHY